MEWEASHGELFRLVVARPDREVAAETPPFRSRKEATARVAGVVRQAARRGQVHGVVLQRRSSFRKKRAQAPVEWVSGEESDVGKEPGAVFLSTSPAATNGRPAEDWATAEYWGAEVIQRILREGATDGAPAAEQAVGPLKEGTNIEPIPWSAVEDAPARASSPISEPTAVGAGRRRPGHRRHVAVAVGLTALAWVMATVWLTGRQFGTIWHDGNSHAAPIATELPFAAPPQELARDTAGTRAASAGRRTAGAGRRAGTSEAAGARDDQLLYVP